MQTSDPKEIVNNLSNAIQSHVQQITRNHSDNIKREQERQSVLQTI